MRGESDSILLIEDNPGDARLIREMLPQGGGVVCSLERVDSLEAGLRRNAQGGIDPVLLDLGLPGSTRLETFCCSVSHDLRAPPRAIDGFSRILLEEYNPKLDEEGRDNLRRADPDRQVEIQIQPALTTEGDANLLRIVLENRLGNAWKFTAKQPAARIEFGATTRQGRPSFFVRDNGAGFNMELSGKLFGAFQRLHTAAEFPGTGVGLATVQRIIHRHGGRVWADAGINRGATFFFSLPPVA
jgi:light-regulated signal transduction histidine kinase (bacteriophytochrome)